VSDIEGFFPNNVFSSLLGVLGLGSASSFLGTTFGGFVEDPLGAKVRGAPFEFGGVDYKNYEGTIT
jgi:hypothetical protein